MQVTPTSSTDSGSQTGTDLQSLSTQMLSQNDFLKLLVAQMTAQNPLSPMDNQDLLAQMVQFSTLQQNTNLQTALTGMENSQNLLQANSLLGRQVTVQVDSTHTAQGVVSSIGLDTATPQVVVNGTPYDLSQVLSISSPSPTP
jgi:flagellar basal-body rod modification protein FlgD